MLVGYTKQSYVLRKMVVQHGYLIEGVYGAYTIFLLQSVGEYFPKSCKVVVFDNAEPAFCRCRKFASSAGGDGIFYLNGR